MKHEPNNPQEPASSARVSGILDFYSELIALKKLLRQGWLLRGIPRERCESVADHVFATAILAIVVSEQLRPDLDRLRVLELALTHELGEIDAGDLTPADRVPLETKHRLERDGVNRLAGLLASGSRLVELWSEYEAGVTPEGRFVRQIEKLEMALQAAAYEEAGSPDLSEFIQSARDRISDPELIQLISRLEEIRAGRPGSSQGETR
jgi:putative hydrolase of HD superfamily